MTNPNALPAASALEAARATVAKMTPGKWEANSADILGPSPYGLLLDYNRAVAAGVRDKAQGQANAAGIVLAVQLLRTLTDEAAVEALARIIDPSSWRVFDGYLADVKRKYKGQNAAYDPEAFKDKKSMALARSIITHILTAGRGA